MASKRLSKELMELAKHPLANCDACPIDEDLFHWQARIVGPPGSVYQGGLFLLDIRFPHGYPFQPPRLTFITKIYHPNINSSGKMSMDILNDNWSPAFTISNVLLSISSLMTDPNPYNPLEPDIANLFKTNRKNFDDNAKEWTLKYASTFK